MCNRAAALTPPAGLHLALEYGAAIASELSQRKDWREQLGAEQRVVVHSAAAGIAGEARTVKRTAEAVVDALENGAPPPLFLPAGQ